MTNLDGSVLGVLAAAVRGDGAALSHLLDLLKEAGHEQEAGKLEGMMRLAEDIAGCLWPGGDRDHQWGPETLDDVAAALARAGRCPGEGRGAACADCGHAHGEHDEYGRCEACNCAGWLDG